VVAVVRSGIRISVASALWTSISSAAAIIIGVASSSLALIAFGLVQVFDFAASVVLVVHFRDRGAKEHLERVVLRVVASGLFALGTVTVVFSVVHFMNHDASSDSTASVVLTGSSLLALTALALRKRVVAVRLPSRALHADSKLSIVGAALAGVTVVGISSAKAFGWWWADAAAALVIAVGAIGMAATTTGA
jgi:divalent metal cation (Fe/Co/Zn/Cd) transporter